MSHHPNPQHSTEHLNDGNVAAIIKMLFLRVRLKRVLEH